MKLRVWFMAAAFLTMGTYAFAMQVAAPAAAPAAGGLSDGSVWKGILNGCLAGVIAAVIGWLKNRDTKTGDMQRFEVKYLIPTVVVGALVGIVASFMKKTPTDLVTSLENSPIYAAITMAVEAGFKIIWRHGTLHLKDMLSDVKGGVANPTPPASPTP
jgi:uncharacterized membrane protein YeaQ/YmgE (transglycosylase-associated protein family)